MSPLSQLWLWASAQRRKRILTKGHKAVKVRSEEDHKALAAAEVKRAQQAAKRLGKKV